VKRCVLLFKNSFLTVIMKMRVLSSLHLSIRVQYARLIDSIDSSI
jgi:hypothetical protein